MEETDCDDQDDRVLTVTGCPSDAVIDYDDEDDDECDPSGPKREDGVAMKRVLLTGMSGTGKSTVIRELSARGYKAVDADSDEWSEWVEWVSTPDEAGTPVEPDRDWVWREDRIGTLLATEDADILFLSGCAVNMVRFLPQFDHIILLSAPAEVIVERLATRTDNSYGKHSDEVARVLSLRETVEPLLRRRAGHEIDTSAPLDEVVATILRIVDPRGRRCLMHALTVGVDDAVAEALSRVGPTPEEALRHHAFVGAMSHAWSFRTSMLPPRAKRETPRLSARVG